MLSISAPMKGAGKADYYLDLAREDYYLSGGEPPGEWYGPAAEELGLSGRVEKNSLKRILNGFDPNTGIQLVQNAGKEDRQAGWDLTFSAPKTVSVLWAVADESLRLELQRAHKEAVKKALLYLSEEAGIARRGKGGSRRESARLIFALFEHGTSRAQDPQLHTHALLPNLGLRADGTAGAIETRPIFRHKMAAGALYRAELDFQLRALGFKTERKNRFLQIIGIPDAVVEEFSKRRAEVEDYLQEGGFSGAIASKIATLKTRKIKGKTPRKDLLAQWKTRAASSGFTTKSITALKSVEEKKEGHEHLMDAENALVLATKNNSHFAARDLVRIISDESQGTGAGAQPILTLVKKVVGDGGKVKRLGSYDHEVRFSTPEVIALEKQMLNTAVGGKERTDWTIRESVLNKKLEELSIRNELTAEQLSAFQYLAGAKGQIQILSGYAGTGKSTAIRPVAELWKAENFTVLGAAPSGIAAKGLGDAANIESMTIHKLLKSVDEKSLRFGPKTILVVDEAAMVGTRQLSKLINLISENGSKLVLSGDEKQLQSIEAGGGFVGLSYELGRKEIKKISRQRESWARKAIIHFAEGRSKDAIKEFASRGLFSVLPTRLEAMDALIVDWNKDGAKDPKGNLILAATNKESDELNRKAQAIRLGMALLGSKRIGILGDEAFVGDRVLFTRNSTKLNVKNGTLGTIIALDSNKNSMSVELNSGHLVYVDLNLYDRIKLGYAITSHRAQGITNENVFALAGGELQDRELAYVQASRARGTTKFYLDEISAGEELTDIVRSMKRSRIKTLATSIMRVANG